MSNVTVDATALGDPRFERLAAGLMINRYEALGRMVHLWNFCTAQETYDVPGAVIDGALGSETGVYSATLAGLVRKSGDLYYVCGTRGRIEWLRNLRVSASAGGKIGGTARAKTAKRNKNGVFAPDRSPAQPDALTLTLTPSLTTDSTDSNTQAAPARAVSRADSPHHQFIARFTELYTAHTGSKPTWAGRNTHHVKELLKEHDVAECIKRAERMFASPPKFLNGDPPTMGVLRSCFDSLAQSSNQRPTPSPWKAEEREGEDELRSFFASKEAA